MYHHEFQNHNEFFEVIGGFGWDMQLCWIIRIVIKMNEDSSTEFSSEYYRDIAVLLFWIVAGFNKGIHSFLRFNEAIDTANNWCMQNFGFIIFILITNLGYSYWLWIIDNKWLIIMCIWYIISTLFVFVYMKMKGIAAYAPK